MLTFLHTSPVHIQTFDQLLAPHGIAARHIVHEDYLARARAEGITPELETAVVTSLLDAASSTDDLVMCTCSTLGGLASQADRQSPATILRVDQPLAARAVALGGKIYVAATVESTLAPTRALLEEEIRRQTAVARCTLSFLLCAEAWPHFEQGNLESYWDSIAKTLDAQAQDADVVVLAQASMAKAAERCQLAAPILSSPALAVEWILRKLTMRND